jgi:hypothetical protein
VRSAGATMNPAHAPAPQALGRPMTFWDRIDWGEVVFWAAVSGVGYYAYSRLSEKKQTRAA